MKQIVSIIVCTFNRAGILPYCLDSLVDQTATPDQYEIIIVNNNSSDTTQEIADQYASRYCNTRVISEPRQGLSYARNRGWQEAESDWIAYIDDDAKAPSEYVSRVLDIIDKYDFDCFGGVYLPWYKYGKPEWFRDRYASNMGVQDYTGPLNSGYASGGNLVIKRSLLEKLGGFNPGFGMNPGQIAYGEETALQMQLRAAGFVIGFDPGLIVEHLVSREKLSPWWHVKSAYARSRDYTCFLDDSPYSSTLHVIKSIIHDLLHYSREATPHLFEPNYFWENWILDVFRPVASHIGYLTGLIVHKRTSI